MMGSGIENGFGFMGMLKLRRRALIAMLALALLMAFQGTALALSWAMTDGFESSSASTTWTFFGDGTHTGSLKYSATYARSGYYYARLTASNGGWSTVGRTVNLWPYTNVQSSSSCTAGAYVRSLNGSSEIIVEVINPATWSPLAIQSHTVSSSTSYTWISSPGWAVNRGDVFVRIEVVSGTYSEVVYVDDMKVTCYW